MSHTTEKCNTTFNLLLFSSCLSTFVMSRYLILIVIVVVVLKWTNIHITHHSWVGGERTRQLVNPIHHYCFDAIIRSNVATTVKLFSRLRSIASLTLPHYQPTLQKSISNSSDAILSFESMLREDPSPLTYKLNLALIPLMWHLFSTKNEDRTLWQNTIKLFKVVQLLE